MKLGGQPQDAVELHSKVNWKLGIFLSYSEQKNWFMFGQFFLGRQVAPQGTKLNPREFSIRWPSIFPLYGPNSINSSFVPQFIETLQSSRLDEPVLLLTTMLPKSHDMT